MDHFLHRGAEPYGEDVPVAVRFGTPCHLYHCATFERQTTGRHCEIALEPGHAIAGDVRTLLTPVEYPANGTEARPLVRWESLEEPYRDESVPLG